MKRWIPAAAAVLVGLVLAKALFWPRGTPTTAPASDSANKPSAKAPTAAGTSVGGSTPGDPASGTDGTGGAEPTLADVAPEGRQPTQAEVATKARLARPFNQHEVNVLSFWGVISKYASQSGDAELGREIALFSTFLDGQARLGEGELDVNANMQRELALVEKTRAAGIPNDEVAPMLDYIEATAKAVLAGEDPTKIHRPTSAEIKGTQ